MACAQQALEDFDVAGRGWDVEILLGQHFDKADNAVTIAGSGSTGKASTPCWT